MGTDIHLGVERFTGSEWTPVEGVLPTNEDWQKAMGHPINHAKMDEFMMRNPTARDYDTFAILAGVRNGVGFAGKKRCEPVEPCFEDRGIPEGTSFEPDGEEWLGGYHSFTYFTYKEAIEKVPWSKEVVTFGLVPLDHYARWKESGNSCPETWCGGGSMEVISEEQAATLIADEDVEYREEDDRHSFYMGPYVEAQWVMRPMADAPFRRWLLSQKMQELADQYGAEKIRILASFDS